MESDGRVGLGTAVGAIGSVGIAAGLVGVRDHFAQVNVALILVLFILIGAVIGGRRAGVVSALMAAVSFDFFHTTPYNSLKIDNGDDIVTTVLLLVVGVTIGEIVVRADRIRGAIGSHRNELTRVHRVARLAAEGEAFEDLVAAVAAELIETFHLQRCWFEAPPFVGTYATLEPTGTLTGNGMSHYTRDGFELPRDGVALPVIVGDRTIGRFVLIPTAGVGVALDRRMIAIALADQLSIVLARRVA